MAKKLILLSATFPTFYERQIVIDSIQLNLVCGLYPTFYRPQRSWGKVIFSQASVGGLVPGGSGPGRGACSREGACSRGAPGPGGEGLVETPPGRLLLRVVCILLECILVSMYSFSCLIHQFYLMIKF